MGITRRKRALLRENQFEELDPVVQKLVKQTADSDEIDAIIKTELENWGFGDSEVRSTESFLYIVTDSAITLYRVIKFSPEVTVDKTFNNYNLWHDADGGDFTVRRGYIELSFPTAVFGLPQEDENFNIVYVNAELCGYGDNRVFILDAFSDLKMNMSERSVFIDLNSPPDLDKLHNDAIDLIHVAADSICRSYSNLCDQDNERKDEDSPIEITDD